MADYSALTIDGNTPAVILAAADTYSGFAIDGNVPSITMAVADSYSAMVLSNGSNNLPIPIYRAKIGNEYVYSLGSPPIGGSDVIIVGYQ